MVVVNIVLNVEKLVLTAAFAKSARTFVKIAVRYVRIVETFVLIVVSIVLIVEKLVNIAALAKSVLIFVKIVE